MQVLPKSFPPLVVRKQTSKIKLHPTVLSFTQNRPLTRPTHSRNQTPHSQGDNRQQPSLRRQQNSFKSVSSARNRSIEQLEADRKGKDEPRVSAKSWIVYEMREGRHLCGKRENRKREMASLTKMMNLATILQLVERAGVDPKLVTVIASRNATSLNGTSAELKRDASYSLYDLFFGMMLPSGNDAAYLIAEVGGILARLLKQEQPQASTIHDPIMLQQAMRKGNNVSLFLKEMNRLAAQLKMYSSNFANPHGLSNPANYSSALDLARLSAYAMNNPLFRSIVNKRKHSYRYNLPQNDKENVHPNQPQDLLEKGFGEGVWENTNKMLGEGWSGIKTGVTPNAGPCLAASVAMMLNGREYEFVVVLLQSESMEARWAQVQKLIEWVLRSRLYLSA